MIESQYLISLMSDSASMRSNSGTSLKNCSTSTADAKPITRVTPDRLHHELLHRQRVNAVHSVENTVAFFPVGGRRQRRHPADVRIQTLRDLFD